MVGPQVLAACLALASQTYNVPSGVLFGLYQVEQGKVGQEVKNTNDTYDLGPMQINTLWVPQLAKHWNVSEVTARQWLRDDACTNIGVAAWILKSHYNETKSMSQAIAQYHSRTPRIGARYQQKVMNALHDHGLVR